MERAGTQVLLITHSPYLVPMRTIDDLKRIARVTTDTVGKATVMRLVNVDSQDTTVPGLGAQWRQLLASRADVRSALFASGVVGGQNSCERSSSTLVDVMKAPEDRPRLDFAAGRVVGRQRGLEAQCTMRAISVVVADELRQYVL